MEQIIVQNLTKKFRYAIKEPGLKGSIKHLFIQKYNSKLAVDNINLTISEGETVAYVGPNGAGKSTTIKMLTGILVPTSGNILVDGIVPYKNREENAQKIGAVFGQRTQLWWDLPVIESLNLLKDIYEIPDSTYKKNKDKFYELLGLKDFIHLSARKISLGQRMRADLAASLLHNPKILYLDEPTIGLDIAVKEKIRTFIKEINSENGTTIMLTTHDIEDIQNICNRIVIIDQGKIIFDGNLEDVRNKYATERVIKVQLTQPNEGIKNIFKELPVIFNETSPREISITFNKENISARDIISRIITYSEIQDFQIEEPKIDTVIRKVYEGSLTISKEGEI